MEKDNEKRGNIVTNRMKKTMNESDGIGIVVDAYQHLLWQNQILKE